MQPFFFQNLDENYHTATYVFSALAEMVTINCVHLDIFPEVPKFVPLVVWISQAQILMMPQPAVHYQK